ncbi:MAG TPA: hypothetical protein VIQ05_17105 [Tardiphaga sp.]
MRFDMPAMPLTEALVEFADKSKMAALVDGEVAQGLRSSPVIGTFVPSVSAGQLDRATIDRLTPGERKNLVQ